VGRWVGCAWRNGAGGELGLPCAVLAGQGDPLLAWGALPAVPDVGRFGEGTGGDAEDEPLELFQPARDGARGAAAGLGHQNTGAW